MFSSYLEVHVLLKRCCKIIVPILSSNFSDNGEWDNFPELNYNVILASTLMFPFQHRVQIFFLTLSFTHHFYPLSTTSRLTRRPRLDLTTTDSAYTPPPTPLTPTPPACALGPFPVAPSIVLPLTPPRTTSPPPPRPPLDVCIARTGMEGKWVGLVCAYS